MLSSKQILIINTIGSVDDLIENYNKQVAKLQEIGCKIIDMINDNNESNLMADIVKFEKGYEIGSKKYYSDLKEQSIHYIRVGDLLNISNTFVDKEDKLKYCNNNDILVAFDGAPGRNNIGLSGAYSSGIYKLVCDEKYKGLIYFEINSKMNQSIIKDHSQGTTILHASKSINYLEYAVFDENDLYYFNSIFNQIISLKNKIYLLNSIKENLLNKYFTNQ